MTQLIDILRALADPTRLRIAALLRALELSVGEIAQILQQSQPRVSRHVRILAEAGLIERRKEGSWVFLRLRSDEQIKATREFINEMPLSDIERRIVAGDLTALKSVQAQRAEAANQYFAEHAAEWDAIRSLHVAEAEVEQAMLRLMHKRRLGHVLDIGTGTGRTAELFAPEARRVTALDRSPEMLRLARARLTGKDWPVELVQGDFYSLPLGDESADTVLLHQVLHYAQAPERVIAEAARVMRPGGHILIVDFASHDREELRAQAAHARLGFSDAQIRGWFASNGLIVEAGDGLSGGELTVRLWLGRRRSDDNPMRADEPQRSAA